MILKILNDCCPCLSPPRPHCLRVVTFSNTIDFIIVRLHMCTYTKEARDTVRWPSSCSEMRRNKRCRTTASQDAQHAETRRPLSIPFLVGCMVICGPCHDNESPDVQSLSSESNSCCATKPILLINIRMPFLSVLPTSAKSSFRHFRTEKMKREKHRRQRRLKRKSQKTATRIQLWHLTTTITTKSHLGVCIVNNISVREHTNLRFEQGIQNASAISALSLIVFGGVSCFAQSFS